MTSLSSVPVAAGLLSAHGDEEEHVAPISLSRLFTEVAIVWWLGALILAAALLYLYGVWKLRMRGDEWPVGRTFAFLVPGLGVLSYASMGGPGYYDDTVFSVHMAQHMLLVMVAPIFLALGAPVTLALRTAPRRVRLVLLSVLHSRVARFFTFPLVCWALYVASPFALYFSGWYLATLEHPWLHEMMHLHFVIVGCLFFWPMIGIDPIPGRVSHPLRFLIVMTTLPFHAILGLAIYTSSTLFAGDYYPSLHQYWLNPWDDQKVAGGLLWSSGEAVGLVMLFVIGVQWMHASEREAIREDRRLDRLEAEAAARAAQAARSADGSIGGFAGAAGESAGAPGKSAPAPAAAPTAVDTMSP